MRGRERGGGGTRTTRIELRPHSFPEIPDNDVPRGIAGRV